MTPVQASTTVVRDPTARPPETKARFPLPDQSVSCRVEGALRLLVVATAFFAVADTVADPDLWGHLTFGREMIERGRILRTDPYSYLSDRPWINHEWAAEIVFAGVFAWAGPRGLIGLKCGFGVLLLGLACGPLRRAAAPSLAVTLLVLAAVLGLRPGLGSVRPQLFTYLMFLLVLRILRSSSVEQPGGLWRLVPVFMMWVNLHGGFLAGLAVVGLWAAVEAAGLLASSAGQTFGLRPALGLAAPLCGVAVAVVANPYGIGLSRFLLETATVARPEISEWSPLSAVSVEGVCYLALVAVSAIGWAGSQGDRRPSEAVVHLAVAAAPLTAVRHLPLFALATLVLGGGRFAEAWQRWLPEGGWCQSTQPKAWLTGLVGVGAAAMAVLGGLSFRGIRVDGHAFPVPSQAVAWVQREVATGRVIADFDWGEFVIWSLGPRVQVAIDGRRETVYSSQTLQHYLAFQAGRPGWQEFLSRGDPTLALLRRGSAPERLLRDHPDWIELHEDRLCTLFGRRDRWARGRRIHRPAELPGEQGDLRWFPASFPTWAGPSAEGWSLSFAQFATRREVAGSAQGQRSRPGVLEIASDGREIPCQPGFPGLDSREPADHPPDELGEDGGGFLARLENLAMGDGGSDDSRGGIGHQGQRQDLHARLPGHNRLGDRRHADDIGSQGAEHPDFGRGFVAGPGKAGVNPRDQVDPDSLGFIAGQGSQLLGVDLGQVDEAGAEAVVVGTAEGIDADEVEVILEHHKIPGPQLRPDTAAGRGQNQGLDSQELEHPDREGDRKQGEALVVMVSALKGQDAGPPFKRPDDQLAGVASHGGSGHVGEVCVWDGDALGEAVGDRAQSRSQDNRDRGQLGDGVADCGRGFRCPGGQVQRGQAHRRIPAMHAERKLASVPARRAWKPSRARSLRRSGANAPMPPSWMPMELRLAKPQRA